MALNAFSIATRVAIFSPCSNVGQRVDCQPGSAGRAPSRRPTRRGRRRARVERAACQAPWLVGAALGGVRAVGLDQLGRRPERLVGDAHHGLGAGDVLGGERVAVRLGSSVRSGLGEPMCERRMSRLGRSVVGHGRDAARPRARRSRRRSRRGARRASRRPRSARRRRRCTASAVSPSMVMWLSS